MPYKVYKIHDDNRNHTCGFLIPNGGWYHIVEMTFDNYQQLKSVGEFPGYSVDYVEGNVGMYDPEGNQVDPATVEVERVSKTVTNYEVVTEVKRGKETTVKSNVSGDERDKLIEESARRGIRIDQRWSTQRIKDAIEKSKQYKATTLAAG